MDWNYRVTRIVRDEQPDAYEIREVYYEGDEIVSWTEDPISPYGESYGELADRLANMLIAAYWPVLDIPDPEAPLS